LAAQFGSSWNASTRCSTASRRADARGGREVPALPAERSPDERRTRARLARRQRRDAGQAAQFRQAILPKGGVDPLAYDTAVDPELRRVFGFDEPLAPIEKSPLLGASPTAARWLGPLALLARIAEGAGNWMVPTASAASSGADLEVLVKRLNSWVPGGQRELREYLPMVLEMLDGTAHKVAERKLPPEHFEIYRDLVATTAWQESCWRQYERRAGQLATVQGPGPSYGLMQVNARVLRGLFDPKGVSRDIGYNSNAGAEILYSYFRESRSAPRNTWRRAARTTRARNLGRP
jgi:hypothetical protein